MNKRDKLIENGFDERVSTLLIKKLERGDDRFATEMLVYEDEPAKVYINRCYLGGWKTISEDELLFNHNKLHSSARKDYLETIEKVKFLKSAL